MEAFRRYLGSLKESGLLSVNMFLVPPARTELRVLSTAITALEDLGVAHLDRLRILLILLQKLIDLVKRGVDAPEARRRLEAVGGVVARLVEEAP